jgi:hypothetical protein
MKVSDEKGKESDCGCGQIALRVKGLSGSGASLAAMLKYTRPKPRYAVER